MANKNKNNQPATEVTNDTNVIDSVNQQTETVDSNTSNEGESNEGSESDAPENNAPETGGQSSTPDEPTSEKLTEIRAAIDKQYGLIEGGQIKPRTPEYIAAISEIMKLQGQEKAEIANIAKLKADLARKEEENRRVAMLTEYREAYVASIADGATDEVKDAFKALHEKLANELLSRGGGSVVRSKDATGAVTVPQGETSKKIESLIIELCEGGKSVSDAVKMLHDENGEYKFSRGTTGAVRTAMKKAGKLEKYGEKAD